MERGLEGQHTPDVIPEWDRMEAGSLTGFRSTLKPASFDVAESSGLGVSHLCVDAACK